MVIVVDEAVVGSLGTVKYQTEASGNAPKATGLRQDDMEWEMPVSVQSFHALRPCQVIRRPSKNKGEARGRTRLQPKDRLSGQQSDQWRPRNWALDPNISRLHWDDDDSREPCARPT